MLKLKKEVFERKVWKKILSNFGNGSLENLTKPITFYYFKIISTQYVGFFWGGWGDGNLFLFKCDLHYEQNAHAAKILIANFALIIS